MAGPVGRGVSVGAGAVFALLAGGCWSLEAEAGVVGSGDDLAEGVGAGIPSTSDESNALVTAIGGGLGGRAPSFLSELLCRAMGLGVRAIGESGDGCEYTKVGDAIVSTSDNATILCLSL